MKDLCAEMRQEIQSLELQNEKLRYIDVNSTEATSTQESSSLRVLARVRPLFPGETQGSISVEDEVFSVRMASLRGKPREFQFEKVLGPESSQTEVFSEISDSLDCVIRGGRACILAYGQTGSGKTYTMTGIIESTLRLLSNESTSSVSISCIEIYNERINNLLSDEPSPKGWKEALSSAEVNLGSDWASEALQLIEKASTMRSTKFTESNEHSSRSHSIITLNFCSHGGVGSL